MQRFKADAGPSFRLTAFALQTSMMGWRSSVSRFEVSFNPVLLSFPPPPHFETKSTVIASEGVLVGFLGSKGAQNKEATRRHVLSALEKDGFAPALME